MENNNPQLYKRQILDTLFYKFLQYLLRKYNQNQRIRFAELRSASAAMFSFNKAETRVFLRLFANEYDLDLSSRGLKINSEVIKRC